LTDKQILEIIAEREAYTNLDLFSISRFYLFESVLLGQLKM